MAQDPAISQARALLKEKKWREAIEVYERRIAELHIMAASKSAKVRTKATGRYTEQEQRFIRAGLAVFLLIVLLGLALVIKHQLDVYSGGAGVF